MKKTLILLLFCVILLNFSSCGIIGEKKSTTDNSTGTAISKNNVTNTAIDEKLSSNLVEKKSDLTKSTSIDCDLAEISSSQKNTENFIKELIEENYANVSLDSLTIMEARNTDTIDDYKVYAVITWNGNSTPSKSQEILQNYSKNIVDFINAKLGNVQTLSLAWLSSNLNGAASLTYEKTDGILSLKEEAFDDNFEQTTKK